MYITILFSFHCSVLLFPKNTVNLTRYGCGRSLLPCLSPVSISKCWLLWQHDWRERNSELAEHQALDWMDSTSSKAYRKSSSCCKILIRHLPTFPFLPFNTKQFDAFDSLLGQLRVMPGFPEGVYAFWVGMPPETQLAILELCALCPSVDTLAVFDAQSGLSLRTVMSR